MSYLWQPQKMFYIMGYNLKNARNGKSISEIPKWPKTRIDFRWSSVCCCSRMDSTVPLTQHDPKDLGLILLVKERRIYFQILSDLTIQSRIFFKKRAHRIFSRGYIKNLCQISMEMFPCCRKLKESDHERTWTLSLQLKSTWLTFFDKAGLPYRKWRK